MSSEGPYGRQGFQSNPSGYGGAGGGASYGGGYNAPSYGQGYGGASYAAPTPQAYGGGGGGGGDFGGGGGYPDEVSLDLVKLSCFGRPNHGHCLSCRVESTEADQFCAQRFPMCLCVVRLITVSLRRNLAFLSEKESQCHMFPILKRRFIRFLHLVSHSILLVV